MRHFLPTLLVLAGSAACGGAAATATPSGTAAGVEGVPASATAAPADAPPPPGAAPAVAACWGTFEPTHTVRAISGRPGDLWAVGLPGVALHFDGSTWIPSCLPSPIAAAAVWSAGPADAWAAGEQSVFRWDGATWSRQALGFTPAGSFVAAWGSSPTDVWLLSTDELVHFDGARFRRTTLDDMRDLGFPFGAFHDVWGTGPGDVWIAADRGTLRFDGATWWASLAAPLQHMLLGVWAADAADAWAVGSNVDGGGVIWRWSGDRWSQEVWASPLAPIYGAVRGAAGAAFLVTANDVLERRGPDLLSLAPRSPPAGAPLALSATELWLPDARGVARWDGARWTRSLEVPR